MRQNQTTVGIEHVAYWLPPRTVDNRETAEAHNFGENFVTEKLGIARRTVLDSSLSLAEMASNAVNTLFAEVDAQPQEVQLLVLVTQTGDFSIPHTSAVVQGLTEIPESCLVFDLSLGCSGFVIGLDVVISLMERLGMSTGILVTADVYSRIVDPSDRSTAPIFGDGASATLFSRRPNWVVGKSDFGSRGLSYDRLILRGSGQADDPKQPLHMDGKAVLGFTRSVIPSSVGRALELNKLSITEVGRVIFHQANAFVLNTLKESLALNQQQMVYSFADIGNVTSSSIPIAFRREILDRDFESKNVLISGFGVGLSWSTTLLYRALN